MMIPDSVRRIFGHGRAQPHTLRMDFTVRLEEDELDGGWIAECLDFPGCMSQGETKEEALHNIVDAIGAVISVRMQRSVETKRFRVLDEGPTEGPDARSGGSRIAISV